MPSTNVTVQPVRLVTVARSSVLSACGSVRFRLRHTALNIPSPTFLRAEDAGCGRRDMLGMDMHGVHGCTAIDLLQFRQQRSAPAAIPECLPCQARPCSCLSPSCERERASVSRQPCRLLQPRCPVPRSSMGLSLHSCACTSATMLALCCAELGHGGHEELRCATMQ